MSKGKRAVPAWLLGISVAALIVGAVASVACLYSVNRIMEEKGRKLTDAVTRNTEQMLEIMARERLLELTVSRAEDFEEKLGAEAEPCLYPVNEIAEEVSASGQGYAFLLDDAGRVLISSRTEGEIFVCQEEAADLRGSGNEELAYLAECMAAGGSGTQKLTLDGRDAFAAYAPLKGSGWSLAAVMPVDVVRAPAVEVEKQLKMLTEREVRLQAVIFRDMLLFWTLTLAGTLVFCIAGAPAGEKPGGFRKHAGKAGKNMGIEKSNDAEKVKGIFRGSIEAVDMSQILESMEGYLKEEKIAEENRTRILVAVDEIFSNVCKYSGAGEAAIHCGISGQRVRVLFEDDGVPYNPLLQPEPDVALEAQERQIGGLGIHIVKKTMDQVIYEYAGGRNCLTIIKEG